MEQESVDLFSGSNCAQIFGIETRVSFMLRVHTMVRFLGDSTPP